MNKKQSYIVHTDPAIEKALFEIESGIETIAANTLPRDERNFDARLDAVDFIEFHIIDRLDSLISKTDKPDQLLVLKHSAEELKAELEQINANLFKKLQATIRSKKYTGAEFKKLLNQYVDFDNGGECDEIGYDNLDLFINGLLPHQNLPGQTKVLAPEMVYYQKTPARIVLELAGKAGFTNHDVFFDLGSGLGQVAILVNLLSGIKTIGVEFEPAFCTYAKDCATALNLSAVTFINADARNADYAAGTVFFMYTPFTGEIMQDVLEALRKVSLSRKIKIITYGPCTAQVASQSWLEFLPPRHDDIYKLAVFNSRMA